MKTMAEFMAENQMLFLYLYSTTFQWFSFHSWIDSLLYVLSIHWKTLILMNIVFILVPLQSQHYSNYFKEDHFLGNFKISFKYINVEYNI